MNDNQESQQVPGIMSNGPENPGEEPQQVPAKLRSWRYLDPEHHHACFRCSGTDKLTTIALERNGIIYGFIFTCGRCLLATKRGTQIVWRLKESDGNSGP